MKPCCKMQALECLLRNRLVFRSAPECVAYTSYSTRCLSKKSNTLPDNFILRQRLKLPSNLVQTPLAARVLCSVPVSRHFFDAKLTPEVESISLESHVQESTLKSHQAGLHSASVLKSDNNFPHQGELASEDSELIHDSFLINFLCSSPFSCSESSTNNFEIELSKCFDTSHVFEVLQANVQNLSIENAGMVLAKLWKILSNGFVDNSFDLRPAFSPVDIPRSSALDKLLQVVEKHFHQLDDIKISCLMVQLHCLGLTHNTFLIHKILHHLMTHCDTLPLEALARIVLFLRSPDLNHSIKGKLMPSLVKYLADCKTKNDFILIDHCVINAQALLPNSLSELHCKKIVDLLDAGEISDEDPKILLRVLQSVVTSENRFVHQEVLTRVCSMLVPKINCLEPTELLRLRNYCWQNKLGRHMMNAVYHQAALAMKDATDPMTRVNLFLSLSPERAQSLQSDMLPIVRHLVRSPSKDYHRMKVLYLMFRSRAINDRNLLDESWDKELLRLDEALSHPELLRDDTLGREAAISRVVFRYLHFNSNLGGQYRHRRLETKIIELLLDQFSGLAGSVTARLSRMSSFVLAYSDPAALPSWLVERLLESSCQFQLKDVVLLTRGVQMSQSLNSKCHYEKYVSKLLSLAHMLSACIQRLAAESTNLNDLTTLSKLSSSVDSIFVKYGVRYSSVKSRNKSLWSQGLQSVYQTPSPPSHASSSSASVAPVPQLPSSSPAQQSPLIPFTTYDHRPQVSALWNEAPSVSDTKETPTLACVAPYLARHLHDMNAKAASTVAHIYGRCNFYNVQVLDCLLKYLYENRAETQGLVVAQALDCTFRVGHAPSLSLEGFRDLAAVLAQDLSSMHGLPLLNSLLALSFYQSLPNSFIKKIFNVGFMDYLDKEMQNCFSKKHYPVRVRQQLMELNRSVCIDYPEANVPWFHEEHCRDHIQTDWRDKDGFFAEVHHVLTRVLGGEHLFTSQPYSPYYYPLDFSFVLNDNEKAVIQPRESSVLQPRMPETLPPLPPGYTRYCILLLNSSRFVTRQSVSASGGVSVHPQLKGPMQLKQRHLEVLGYDVVSIAKHEWQSMSLGTAASKEAYLRDKIFGSRS